MYETTPDFLRVFGLESLADLPDIEKVDIAVKKEQLQLDLDAAQPSSLRRASHELDVVDDRARDPRRAGADRLHPVGVDAAYGEGGVLLSAKISFFRLRILPAKPKKPKKPKKAKKSKQQKPAAIACTVRRRRMLQRQKQPRKRSSPFPAACAASCAL